MRSIVRLLFVCVGNSCRSQMAEGLARELGGSHVEAFSAGTEPRTVQPIAVQVMAEVGIDISHQRSKDLAAFTGQTFDFMITLCDRAKQQCPVLPGALEQIHWGFDDPAEVVGSAEHRARAFRRVRDEIRQRLRLFLLANGIVNKDRMAP